MKPRMPKPRPKPRLIIARRPNIAPRPHPDLLPARTKPNSAGHANVRLKEKKGGGDDGSRSSGGSRSSLDKNFYKGLAVGATSAIGAREITDYDARSDKKQNYWQWNKGGRK